MKKLILLLALTCLFIVGCGDTETSTASSGKAYIGGDAGVTAAFEQFATIEGDLYTIYDSQTFPLEVTIHNKGEYKLKPKDVKVKIIGVSEDEFSGIAKWEKTNTQDVDKISELNKEGGQETISFSSDVKYASKVTGLLDRTFFATVDYNYETYVLVPEVCLKENLADKKVCEVKEAKDVESSSGPVTVTAVQEDTAGKGVIALKLSVKKTGEGIVTLQGTEFKPTQDKIAFTLNDPAWKCTSSGKENEARLLNNEAEIVCKLKDPLKKDTLAIKQVKMTLKYTYRDTIEEKIRIKQTDE